jgi:heterotetrameric sarcosine oxidase gamma subunit
VSNLDWTESLGGPRSLATAADLAVAALEDPGIVEIALPPSQAADPLAPVAGVLGAPLPEPHQITRVGALRVYATGSRHWQVMLDRPAVPALLAHLVSIEAAYVADFTGAVAALRVAGGAAAEILMATCSLDPSALPADTIADTRIAGAGIRLLREAAPVPSWLALVPRSAAEHVAQALVDAARSPHRSGLFARHRPPPV